MSFYNGVEDRFNEGKLLPHGCCPLRFHSELPTFFLPINTISTSHKDGTSLIIAKFAADV